MILVRARGSGAALVTTSDPSGCRAESAAAPAAPPAVIPLPTSAATATQRGRGSLTTGATRRQLDRAQAGESLAKLRPDSSRRRAATASRPGPELAGAGG